MMVGVRGPAGGGGAICDRRRLLCGLWVASLPTVLGGCVTAQLLSGEPGTDVSAVRAGARREDVEKIVGAPVREWQSIHGVTYCLYGYFAGVAPDVPTAALFLLLGLGTWDLFATLEGKDARHYRDQSTRRRGALIVSYDDHSIALGVFAETEALPPDGKRSSD